MVKCRGGVLDLKYAREKFDNGGGSDGSDVVVPSTGCDCGYGGVSVVVERERLISILNFFFLSYIFLVMNEK